MQIDLSSFGDPDKPRLSAVQRTLILKGFGGFSGLSAEGLALLGSICTEKHYNAGDVMHEPGKPVSAFHLVIDGEVQMYRNGKPSRVFTGRSTVGGLASLAQDPNGAHAVAKTDVFALTLHGEDMNEVFEDNFNVILGVMTGLGHALRDFQMKAGGGAAVDMNKRIDKVDTSHKLTLVDKMFILRKATNFADVSIEALAQMARDAEEVRWSAGDQMWPLDQIAEYSILMVDGVVECQPKDREPFRFGPSFYVGSLDSITRSPRWYAAVAQTDIVALKVYAHRLLDLLEDHTDMALAMCRNFARGVTSLIEMEVARAESAAESAAESEETSDAAE